ncbi:hypothetical protein SISNIDRAFT_407569 [Sistotremastrum niveocremeum HHB9708]|uniref:Uncharacterized protein n=1 Tax=Sistotremastrum niveocremeum HHB9708 TaxID=1314777 RepID=A0A164Y0V5_9AGAM|nr:hypothetical protein SISNIDRAFT_407569 [Sistotremastrum niveocremeum HHB9708]
MLPPSNGKKFSRYMEPLRALSARTGTPLPSLVASFAVLHELTAIIPLVGTFLVARQLGIGERVVRGIRDGSINVPTGDSDDGSVTPNETWVYETGKRWIDEGEQMAGRLGRRYGIFGFEKGQSKEVNGDLKPEQGTFTGPNAGDIANVVVAYGITKAMLPIRIGASLYLSPAFSRRVVEPVRLSFVRLFRKSPRS